VTTSANRWIEQVTPRTTATVVSSWLPASSDTTSSRTASSSVTHRMNTTPQEQLTVSRWPFASGSVASPVNRAAGAVAALLRCARIRNL
jgi:hypothetical protein